MACKLISLAFVKTLAKDDEYPQGRAAVDYYFIQDDGGMFKSTLLYEPYFYVSCKVSGQTREIQAQADGISISPGWNP